jgi:hypothetical protein
LRKTPEAMKQKNVNYSKKLEQWSNETFNAGKEIEAMKRLMLHCIASKLYRFLVLVPSFAHLMQNTIIFLRIRWSDSKDKDCRQADFENMHL